MITPCRFIYPYFDNPGMLEMQVKNWNRYDGELRRAVSIILVDDHSAKTPVPLIEHCKTKIACYRLKERIPWNMHQCRNIGAREACLPEENSWLFMSDIDIMLTPEAAFTMLSKQLDPAHYYTMDRVFAPEFLTHKIHPNTFLVKHAAFWQVNGYDLDLTPVGGGGYGGDTKFTHQLANICPPVHLPDVTLIGYGRRSRDGTAALPDADTTSLSRADWHERYIEAWKRKRDSGDMRSINPIRTPYERIM